LSTDLAISSTKRPAGSNPSKQRPGKPRPSGRRSAIHYPTPQEAQEEAEAEERAAQLRAGGTIKRSLLARVWHEFLRY
jgi:hypothetical protein